MSYRDWSEEQYDEFYDAAFQTIFNEIPSISDLSTSELRTAEDLFSAGWLEFNQYSPEQLDAIREEFYDYVGIDGLTSEEWADYREIYDNV